MLKKRQGNSRHTQQKQGKTRQIQHETGNTRHAYQKIGGFKCTEHETRQWNKRKLNISKGNTLHTQ